ncbi:sensor histidine kinase [Alkalihalobacterium chitinilyticum]|uniref:histidine kinase n=1 Tax=Alkalihalobacterium chitinilyticum TaxID=2980103 RepID=A0ABT5VHV3_9BACI|nr:sensor histidine kinase [Alkalihalobacterium chitinilyticum]MDE5414327.1 sensor histidine kinase [Alkalihalobacterium chitinilyticum]
MSKKITLNFLKDRALYMAFYSLSMACIIGFFYLSEPTYSEYFYSILMGVFLLIVFIIIDFARYYDFNSKVELILDGQTAEIQPFTEEQKSLKKLIDKNKRDAIKENSELKKRNKERLYFLSHWMHHLKTPVSVIELMIDKESQEHLSTGLEQIRNENQRLHTSIEQGLTMIRMESFENDFEPRSIDLVASLRKIINNRKSEFIYYRLFPSIQFDQEAIYVVTDKKWNEILLDQLISNAIKYSSNLAETKKVFFRITEEENSIILSIKDEGVGIPDYDIDRVFEPFFTGENGRRYRNSSGIGLYLCKKVSERLGQTVTIQSEVSKGTEVQVRYLTKL